MVDIIEILAAGILPAKSELAKLIAYYAETGDAALYEAARSRAEATRDAVYGRRIFLRVLIEISSY